MHLHPLRSYVRRTKNEWRTSSVVDVGERGDWLDELVHASAQKTYLADLAAYPLLGIDDLGMQKRSRTAAEDLLEVIHPHVLKPRLLTSRRTWTKLTKQ